MTATTVDSYTLDTEEFHPQCLVKLLVSGWYLDRDALNEDPVAAVQRYCETVGLDVEDLPWPVFSMDSEALDADAPCAYRLCPEAG
jgi:hypothetical protein